MGDKFLKFVFNTLFIKYSKIINYYSTIYYACIGHFRRRQ